MRAWAMILLAATLLLTGCGQKGPLYLPQPPQGDNSADNDA